MARSWYKKNGAKTWDLAMQYEKWVRKKHGWWFFLEGYLNCYATSIILFMGKIVQQPKHHSSLVEWLGWIFHGPKMGPPKNMVLSFRQKCPDRLPYPIGSMYGIFAYLPTLAALLCVQILPVVSIYTSRGSGCIGRKGDWVKCLLSETIAPL